MRSPPSKKSRWRSSAVASALWKLLAFVGIVACRRQRWAWPTTTPSRHAQSLGVRQLPRHAADGQRHEEPASDTLAARHFKNHWIPEDQCYECHSDYGLSGDMEAKMEGFRHLARYTTRTYQEPIKFRGTSTTTTA